MWLIDALVKRKKQKQAKITFIGPSFAGKTTLLHYLETGEVVNENINTTLGMTYRNDTVKIGKWKISVIDTGGQQVYQQVFWELAVQQADAVIFMIDATVRPETHPDLFELVKDQIQYALDIVTEEQPLLFLLNKQDLTDKNPIKRSEALILFNLSPSTPLFDIKEISAKYGTNVMDAMTWLLDAINEAS